MRSKIETILIVYNNQCTTLINNAISNNTAIFNVEININVINIYKC